MLGTVMMMTTPLVGMRSLHKPILMQLSYSFQRRKEQGNSTAKHTLIGAAREVKTAFANYQRNPSHRSEVVWKSAKQKFQKIYQELEEQEFDDMIKQVKEADYQNRHG
jgi:biopolymer transport protein ExbB/TolQ